MGEQHHERGHEQPPRPGRGTGRRKRDGFRPDQRPGGLRSVRPGRTRRNRRPVAVARTDSPANCTIHAVADPTLADFVGDDTSEVIAATTEKQVAAYDPSTGKQVFQHNLTDYGYTQPVVAGLVGDETNELVVADVRGTVFVLRPNGTTVWTKQLSSYTFGQPTVEDFDGDSEPEVVVGTSGGQLVLFERNGTVAWNRTSPFESSITWMTTGQADADRATEIATATVEGRVAMIDGKRGSVQWKQDFGDFAAVHAFGDGDGDNDRELYAVTKDGKLRSLMRVMGRSDGRRPSRPNRYR